MVHRGFSELFSENCGVDCIEREEEEKVLRAALQELPTQMMVALVMCYAHAYSNHDIALRTGIAEDRVEGITASAARMVRNKCLYDYNRLASLKVSLPKLDTLDIGAAPVEELTVLSPAG